MHAQLKDKPRRREHEHGAPSSWIMEEFSCKRPFLPAGAEQKHWELKPSQVKGGSLLVLPWWSGADPQPPSVGRRSCSERTNDESLAVIGRRVCKTSGDCWEFECVMLHDMH